VAVKFGIPAKLLNNKSKSQLCEKIYACSGTSLPLPPMNKTRVQGYDYYVASNSPLTARDFIKLFGATKKTSLGALASKVGINNVSGVNRESIKSMIIQELESRGVPEPLKIKVPGLKAKETVTPVTDTLNHMNEPPVNNAPRNNGTRNNGNATKKLNGASNQLEFNVNRKTGTENVNVVHGNGTRNNVNTFALKKPANKVFKLNNAQKKGPLNLGTPPQALRVFRKGANKPGETMSEIEKRLGISGTKTTIKLRGGTTTSGGLFKNLKLFEPPQGSKKFDAYENLLREIPMNIQPTQVPVFKKAAQNILNAPVNVDPTVFLPKKNTIAVDNLKNKIAKAEYDSKRVIEASGKNSPVAQQAVAKVNELKQKLNEVKVAAPQVSDAQLRLNTMKLNQEYRNKLKKIQENANRAQKVLQVQLNSAKKNSNAVAIAKIQAQTERNKRNKEIQVEKERIRYEDRKAAAERQHQRLKKFGKRGKSFFSSTFNSARNLFRTKPINWLQDPSLSAESRARVKELIRRGVSIPISVRSESALKNFYELELESNTALLRRESQSAEEEENENRQPRILAPTIALGIPAPHAPSFVAGINIPREPNGDKIMIMLKNEGNQDTNLLKKKLLTLNKNVANKIAEKYNKNKNLTSALKAANGWIESEKNKQSERAARLNKRKKLFNNIEKYTNIENLKTNFKNEKNESVRKAVNTRLRTLQLLKNKKTAQFREAGRVQNMNNFKMKLKNLDPETAKTIQDEFNRMRTENTSDNGFKLAFKAATDKINTIKRKKILETLENKLKTLKPEPAKRIKEEFNRLRTNNTSANGFKRAINTITSKINTTVRNRESLLVYEEYYKLGSLGILEKFNKGAITYKDAMAEFKKHIKYRLTADYENDINKNNHAADIPKNINLEAFRTLMSKQKGLSSLLAGYKSEKRPHFKLVIQMRIRERIEEIEKEEGLQQFGISLKLNSGKVLPNKAVEEIQKLQKNAETLKTAQENYVKARNAARLNDSNMTSKIEKELAQRVQEIHDDKDLTTNQKAKYQKIAHLYATKKLRNLKKKNNIGAPERNLYTKMAKYGVTKNEARYILEEFNQNGKYNKALQLLVDKVKEKLVAHAKKLKVEDDKEVKEIIDDFDPEVITLNKAMNEITKRWRYLLKKGKLRKHVENLEDRLKFGIKDSDKVTKLLRDYDPDTNKPEDEKQKITDIYELHKHAKNLGVYNHVNAKKIINNFDPELHEIKNAKNDISRIHKKKESVKPNEPNSSKRNEKTPPPLKGENPLLLTNYAHSNRINQNAALEKFKNIEYRLTPDERKEVKEFIKTNPSENQIKNKVETMKKQINVRRTAYGKNLNSKLNALISQNNVNESKAKTIISDIGEYFGQDARKDAQKKLNDVLKNLKSSTKPNEPNNSTKAKAATKIQKIVRGRRARKKVKLISSILNPGSKTMSIKEIKRIANENPNNENVQTLLARREAIAEINRVLSKTTPVIQSSIKSSLTLNKKSVRNIGINTPAFNDLNNNQKRTILESVLSINKLPDNFQTKLKNALSKLKPPSKSTGNSGTQVNVLKTLTNNQIQKYLNNYENYMYDPSKSLENIKKNNKSIIEQLRKNGQTYYNTQVDRVGEFPNERQQISLKNFGGNRGTFKRFQNKLYELFPPKAPPKPPPPPPRKKQSQKKNPEPEQKKQVPEKTEEEELHERITNLNTILKENSSLNTLRGFFGNSNMNTYIKKLKNIKNKYGPTGNEFNLYNHLRASIPQKVDEIITQIKKEKERIAKNEENKKRAENERKAKNEEERRKAQALLNEQARLKKEKNEENKRAQARRNEQARLNAERVKRKALINQLEKNVPGIFENRFQTFKNEYGALHGPLKRLFENKTKHITSVSSKEKALKNALKNLKIDPDQVLNLINRTKTNVKIKPTATISRELTNKFMNKVIREMAPKNITNSEVTNIKKKLKKSRK
jgi:hypothetical protein